jgi:hypothetical protein
MPRSLRARRPGFRARPTVADRDTATFPGLAELVTPEIAAHVLWHFIGPTCAPAMEPGSFVARLIPAIAAADPQNRGRLYLGFPGYALAVTVAQDVDDGMEMLAEIARSLFRR